VRRLQVFFLGVWLSASGFYRSIRTTVYGVFSRPYKTVVLEEALPKELRRKTLYIVQEDDYQEQAAMICPCGCGAILHMNLLPDERPCWRVTQHADGTASLHPSVWRKKDCKSHF